MDAHADPRSGLQTPRSAPAAARSPADVAYRLAWWSLALFPVGLVAAFLVGEGLLAKLAADPQDPTGWQALAAGLPAIVVFALPAAVVWGFAHRATRLGRSDGWVPALVAIVLVLGFTATNLLSALVRFVLG
jgi:hypothetical protein